MNSKTDGVNLEKILDNLSSDEARRAAISQLIGRVNLLTSRVDRAIEDYEKAGRFVDAAYLAVKAGMNERAKELRTLADLIG